MEVVRWVLFGIMAVAAVRCFVGGIASLSVARRLGVNEATPAGRATRWAGGTLLLAAACFAGSLFLTPYLAPAGAGCFGAAVLLNAWEVDNLESLPPGSPTGIGDAVLLFALAAAYAWVWA